VKKIYLIRHGETLYNQLGLVQGSGIDSDLNELGYAQASSFYKAYQYVHFDKIYTSVLKRTHQTVWKFIAKGTPWQQLAGLNELGWGHREGRVITQHDDQEYKLIINSWHNGEMHVKPDGGESPLEVMEREKIALQTILENDDENTILICMHGRAMRIFLCLLLDVPLKAMDRFQHSNTCLYVLHYTIDGQFKLIVENDNSHLKNIAQEVEIQLEKL
jgi:broad specificity phosphatase PhoE